MEPSRHSGTHLLSQLPRSIATLQPEIGSGLSSRMDHSETHLKSTNNQPDKNRAVYTSKDFYKGLTMSMRIYTGTYLAYANYYSTLTTEGSRAEAPGGWRPMSHSTPSAPPTLAEGPPQGCISIPKTEVFLRPQQPGSLLHGGRAGDLCSCAEPYHKA